MLIVQPDPLIWPEPGESCACACPSEPPTTLVSLPPSPLRLMVVICDVLNDWLTPLSATAKSLASLNSTSNVSAPVVPFTVSVLPLTLKGEVMEGAWAGGSLVGGVLACGVSPMNCWSESP